MDRSTQHRFRTTKYAHVPDAAKFQKLGRRRTAGSINIPHTLASRHQHTNAFVLRKKKKKNACPTRLALMVKLRQGSTRLTREALKNSAPANRGQVNQHNGIRHRASQGNNTTIIFEPCRHICTPTCPVLTAMLMFDRPTLVHQQPTAIRQISYTFLQKL